MSTPALVGVPCVECDSPVIATLPGRNWVGLDEQSLVVPDKTFSDSKGLIAVCSDCLGRFSAHQYVATAMFFPCFNKWKRETRCENTVLMLYSIYGSARAFGGEVRELTILGDMLLYDLESVKCNACIKASRPLARLKQFVASLVTRAG
jgi:hypothetical protein